MSNSELIQVGNSYNVPVKTFYLTPKPGKTIQELLATLPTNIPGGSICEYLCESGLYIYMFMVTDEGSSWVLI